MKAISIPFLQRGWRFCFIAATLVAGLLPAAAQPSESRYTKEFVFPLYMRNVSVGMSPVMLKAFMNHSQQGVRTTVVLPPVHLMVGRCFLDMNNAGSLGSLFFLSYGRYKYTYTGENGYGSNVVNVRASTTHTLIGVDYHYTIRTRLETYLRLMGGVEFNSFKSNRAGSTPDRKGRFIWNAVGGVRYFFSNSMGVYAEGGYTSGGVNAGLTYRW